MDVIELKRRREQGLLEDLASMVRRLVLRAGDGACREGRLVTLHAYPAIPFGEKPLVERAIERTLTPVDEDVPLAAGRMDLALDVLGNAGRPSTPLARIAARSALLHLMDDPEVSSSDKAAAFKALGRLNLPRLSRLMLTRVRLLVGILQGPDSKRVELASLDDSGFPSVPDVAPDAQCWLRPRHGPILALEIAERTRREVLVAGTALKITSPLNDWTLDFEPAGAGGDTSDVGMVLKADEALGFRGAGLAVVAALGEGGTERYVAELNDRGEGTFSGLPGGRHNLRIALVPKSAASASETGFSVSSEVRVESAQSRFQLRTTDPVLQNTRCVCVQRRAAGKTVLVGKASVAGESGPDGWRGRADGRFSLTAGPVRARVPEKKIVERGGVERTRSASPAAAPAQGTRAGEFVCLVML